MSKFTIKPTDDYVLLKPLSKDELEGKTSSGIIIPDTAEKERPEQGKIIDVGDGRINDDGKRIPVPFKKGMRVFFDNNYNVKKIKIGGVEHVMVKSSDIFAIIH
ncbi:MAG: co-chaperone GroES [Candidatus Niyogibacteria bacterium]|nr:co-chaperone GroES [Candidatus Niyogibacteria bacterium]